MIFLSHTVSLAHISEFNAYLKTNRVMIVITRNTMETDIPMYETKVNMGPTFEDLQSSCLRQISYEQNQCHNNSMEYIEHS